jgi:hypothetical protein
MLVLAACERGSSAPPTDPGDNAGPAFTLSSGNASVVTPRGWNAIVNLTVARQANFNGALVLTVEGLPKGVTGAFSSPTVPASVASAKLNLEADSTVAFGTYPVVIRGASGNTTATTTVSVSVPRPSFQLSSTNAVSVVAGSAIPATIAVGATREYFYRGTITFTVSDVPAGVEVGSLYRIGPDENNTGLFLRVGASAVPGSYVITIRAQGPDADDRVTTTNVTITR